MSGQHCLLAILAHPDDETFRCGGTLALLARRGVQVWVLCATRGEAGDCGDPPVCQPETLGAAREAELQYACVALEIESPILLDYQDGTLLHVAEVEAVSRVIAVIQQLRPQVLLTWPPDGLSGHPDHIAVSHWTALAFEQAGALGSDAPAAVYHLAVPQSVAQTLGLTYLHAAPDEEITLTVDVGPVWEQKLAAIRCHHTQLGVTPVLRAPAEQQRLFLGWEHFTLGALRGPQPAEDFLQQLKDI